MVMTLLPARLAEAGLRLWSRVTPTERGGYRLARGVRRLVPREQWQRDFHLPSGMSMALDLAIYPDCCMAYGLYEASVRRALLSRLRPGDHFVDAGANIGYFTLLAAQRVGLSGRVDAFEPEPHNRQRLADHVHRNGFADRVTIHPLALSDAAGTASIRFFGGLEGHNHGESSLFAAEFEPSAVTQVPTARLDEVLRGTTPRVIKMDIEGAEALAVEGMSGLLRGDKPPVLIGEVNPTQARRAGVAASQWVQTAMAVQPRYRVYEIGTRLRPVNENHADLGKTQQLNVLLEPTGLDRR